MQKTLALFALLLSGCLAPVTENIDLETETYQLDNGMTVTLHPDHSLPKVLINTWFAVGSKDEAPGRTGFAHLFEHLMFMGTKRVPGSQFDVLMEAGGGSNNATTNKDRTNYFSMGPSSLLPTLLWLDADRLDALADNMTQEKLDAQRAVVRNERRQTTENVPYGKARLILSTLLYPKGHPYYHSVIGSHEDLEAATVDDVVNFFHRFYVPCNASLVVAGDFEPAEVKPIIEATFGAVETKEMPSHREAEPVVMASEARAEDTDKVRFPRLYLAWHSPAYYADGDGEMDLIGSILSGGPSTRLEKRLVIEKQLAQSVIAYQASGELGSTFQILATARAGVSLDEIKAEILDVLAEFERNGPTEEELARVKIQSEATFRRRMEDLNGRADAMNAYLRHFGEADSFQRDLDRWLLPTASDLQHYAGVVFGEGRADLRIYPDTPEFASKARKEEASPAESSAPVAQKDPKASTRRGSATPRKSSLDQRPDDFESKPVELFTPSTFELSNGIEVVAIPLAGKQLFAGSLLVRGGESLVSQEQAGLSNLLARMMDSGAAGLDAGAFAEAVEGLGASISTSTSTEFMSVSVDGLTSQFDETLDRFADVVLRANLEESDFDREKQLTLSSIEARKDNAQAVAGLLTQSTTYGADHPRGRATSGEKRSVSGIELADVRGAQARLMHPGNASFVFVGDFSFEQLKSGLESRFGEWSESGVPDQAQLVPLTKPAAGRILLFDRPGAPQTVISISRPLDEAEGVAQAARQCVDTVLGGSFTSRLNSNLRERNGYTYGARSRISQDGEQYSFGAGAAVRTDVTGASLVEFKKEFAAMQESGISESELGKAIATRTIRLVQTAETTSGLLRAISGLVTDGRDSTALSEDLNYLGQVEMQDAQRAAKSDTLDWDKLLIVLVGDKEAVLPQLEEAGFPEPEIVE